MPELPEIETIKNDLLPHVRGKRITKVTFLPDQKIRIIRRFTSIKMFIKGVQGTRIQNLRRRAKYLVFDLEPSCCLIMHLGMSGQLRLQPASAPREPFLRAIFLLNNNTELRFIDPRKFGEVFLVLPDGKKSALDLDRLGPEPLEKEFSLKYLKSIVQKSKRTVKTLLLDQKAIAGIGNIYSDEILFLAKILPTRQGCTLTDQETKSLYQAIRKIIKAAISQRGTTAADKRYRDGLGRMGTFQNKLRAYQQRGNPCQLCGTTIQCLRIGGRSACFCPSCQK